MCNDKKLNNSFSNQAIINILHHNQAADDKLNRLEDNANEVVAVVKRVGKLMLLRLQILIDGKASVS